MVMVTEWILLHRRVPCLSAYALGLTRP